jgi:hypothetical protein
VQINGITWSPTVSDNPYYSIGLWEYGASDTVYYSRTTADGNVAITFGNGINGATPSNGATVTIQYVTTMGAAANNLNLLTSPVN